LSSNNDNEDAFNLWLSYAGIIHKGRGPIQPAPTPPLAPPDPASPVASEHPGPTPLARAPASDSQLDH